MTVEVTEPTAAGRVGLTRSAVWFVAIGATNNLVSYALFALFTKAFGMQPIVAVTITYVLGMVISFLGNRRLTFKHSGSALPTILKFVAANAVGYGVNVLILHVFTGVLGYPALIVQLFAIVVVATITFFSMRLWVFRPDAVVPPTAETETVAETGRSGS